MVIVVAIVAICLTFSIGFFGCSNKNDNADDDVAEQTSATEVMEVEDTAESEAVANEPISYTMTISDFKNLPKSKKVKTFSLADGTEAPDLTDGQSDAIDTALDDIESLGECSFLMVDLATGQGIAYNRTEDIYSASTIKAAYVSYLLQSGTVSGVSSGADSSYSIEAAITYSDNDSYFALRESYGASGFAEWLSKMGIGKDVAGDDYDYYADYSATDLGKIWLKTYKYLNSGSDDAEWFADLLLQTSTSYIRDGVGTKASVMNKAGWINEGEHYCSTSDAGIVEDGEGNDYLMVILTSQPYTEEAAENVSALAKALFEARRSIAG